MKMSATFNALCRDSSTLLSLIALGFTSILSFTGVGTLYLLDLVCVVLAGWFVLRGRRPMPGSLWWLLGLAAIWLISAMVTDVVRQSPPENYLRGWAKIVAFMVVLFAVAQATQGRTTRLAAFLLGLGAATCVQTLFFPNAYQAGEPWKFGYAAPAALLSVVVASLPLNGKSPSAVRQIGLPLMLALVNLALNYRSLFAILLAVAAVTALMHLARLASPARRVMTPLTGAAILAIFVFGGWAAGEAYGRIAESGVLGEEARQKYVVQTSGDLGLLLGGRSESFASVRAISDSPILGHGSWAEDRRYRDMMLLAMRERGREATGGPVTSALIPSHSYLLGAWVEAGVAGAVFWTTCLFFSLLALMRLIDLRTPWTPFLALCGVQLLWAIPFSPFGADVRFTAAAQIVAVLVVLEEMRRHSLPSARSRNPLFLLGTQGAVR